MTSYGKNGRLSIATRKYLRLYIAKALALSELYSLMDAGFNFRNAPDSADGHPHANVTTGFDYLDVIFKVAGTFYQG